MVDLILFDKFFSEGLPALVLVVDEFNKGMFEEVLDMFALHLFGLGLDVVLQPDQFLVFLPVMLLFLLADLSRVQFGLLFSCS
jgi:hypothetical protein